MNLDQMTDNEILAVIARESALPSESTILRDMKKKLGGPIGFVGGPHDGSEFSVKSWQERLLFPCPMGGPLCVRLQSHQFAEKPSTGIAEYELTQTGDAFTYKFVGYR